jgi:hypothetical protein
MWVAFSSGLSIQANGRNGSGRFLNATDAFAARPSSVPLVASGLSVLCPCDAPSSELARCSSGGTLRKRWPCAARYLASSVALFLCLPTDSSIYPSGLRIPATRSPASDRVTLSRYRRPRGCHRRPTRLPFRFQAAVSGARVRPEPTESLLSPGTDGFAATPARKNVAKNCPETLAISATHGFSLGKPAENIFSCDFPRLSA